MGALLDVAEAAFRRFTRDTLLVVFLVAVVSSPACLAVEPESVAPAACYEDEACWDCSTMGNRVCGPVGES